MNFQIRKNCCPEFATQDLCFDKNLLFGYPLFMLLMIMEKVRSYKLRTAVLLLFEHTKDSLGWRRYAAEQCGVGVSVPMNILQNY